jgi:hypothetical protein
MAVALAAVTTGRDFRAARVRAPVAAWAPARAAAVPPLFILLAFNQAGEIAPVAAPAATPEIVDRAEAQAVTAEMAERVTALAPVADSIRTRGTSSVAVLISEAVEVGRRGDVGHTRSGWLRSALPETNRYVSTPSLALTDWKLFPQRLVLSEDPKAKLFFSRWNAASGEWVASGFDAEMRKAMPRGEQ